MSLESYLNSAELYRARGDDVNPNRPIFTGDVFDNLVIFGSSSPSLAIIISHPCSMRRGVKLRDQILVARVDRGGGSIRNDKWKTGHYFNSPLPELDLADDFVVVFDTIGGSRSGDFDLSHRIACLSDFGINLLQQRLTHYLTRTVIETFVFQEATANTLAEAELMEEWMDELILAGFDMEVAANQFNEFFGSGDPNLRLQLQDPQKRSSVRQACRRKIKDIRDGQKSSAFRSPGK